MKRVKVIFELEESDMHSHGSESLWALPISEGIFRIDNVPFYIYGISNRDLVKAEARNDGIFAFAGTYEKGGHSTYRVFLREGTSDSLFESRWKEFERLGCSKEGGGEGLYAIDVPPETNIYEVYALLERGEEEGAWVFEEGDCGHSIS